MTHMNFLTCLLIVFLKNGPTPASFVGVSGIRTRILGIEGEHADLLTTTTAQCLLIVCQSISTLVVFVWTVFISFKLN